MNSKINRGPKKMSKTEQQARKSFDTARKSLMRNLRKDTANLNQESKESMQELLRINELGMLTSDSQQGNVEKTTRPVDKALFARIRKQVFEKYILARAGDGSEDINVIADELYRQKGGTYTKSKSTTMKERAYLMGYMDVVSAHWLCVMLNQQSNIVAWDIKLLPEYSTSSRMTVPVTYTDDHQEGYYSPFDGPYSLFPSSRLSDDVILLPDVILADGTALKNFPKAGNKYFAYVQIMDARYGHSVTKPDGLFKQVIKALETLKASNTWRAVRRR